MEKVIDIDNPILAATEKYKKHRSIRKINEKSKTQNHSFFKHISSKEVKRIIKDIKIEKSYLKKLFSSRLSPMANLYIDKSAFPYVPTLEKDNTFEKTDCRPISILLILSSL